MTNNDKLKIEELKEVGQEYRYRDQLMVQEFSLSMVAIGILLNLLRDQNVSFRFIVLQLFGACFLFLLSWHLNHINQDRHTALNRKEELRKDLGFASIHGGVKGQRFSTPRVMMWFSTAATMAWAIWTVITIYNYIHLFCHKR
jgi:hypothetical protein